MTFSCMRIIYFHPITLSFVSLPFLLIFFYLPVISLYVFLFYSFACLILLAGPLSFYQILLRVHESSLSICVSQIFFCCYDECPDESNSQKEGFKTLACSLKSSSQR